MILGFYSVQRTSQLTTDRINQGESTLRGLYEAGKELSMICADGLEDAIKAIGEFGQTAKDVAQCSTLCA